MNKKIILYLIHIPVWIIALFIAYFFSSDDMPPGGSNYVFFSTTTFAFWFLASFYAFYSFLVPKYLEKSKNNKFWIHTALFTIIIMPAVNLILSLITKVSALSLSESLSVQGLAPWTGSILGTIFCGGLGSLYRFSIDWFNNLHIKKDIENIKLQSELSAIKSKLNPHLLFNTLNNIYTLIQTKSDKASLALSKLSNLLRYVVYETENKKITIQKEIDIILQYIDLEKMRLSNPDSVSFSKKISKEVLVPPMLFLPFIENGFKHSNLNDFNQKLDISISENNNILLFNCINTFNDKTTNNDKKGIGIELVKKRLELLYPKSHNLNISKENNEYCVTLKINLPSD
ncbi:MAG: histidine kinase [Bacteroidales bacterium]|nr:histidine kinase [Bacteroidales bacterium]